MNVHGDIPVYSGIRTFTSCNFHYQTIGIQLHEGAIPSDVSKCDSEHFHLRFHIKYVNKEFLASKAFPVRTCSNGHLIAFI